MCYSDARARATLDPLRPLEFATANLTSLQQTPQILCLLSSLLVACGSQGRRPGNQPSVDASIALHPYSRDLRTVHAQLGRDTLNLLFDTGGGATPGHSSIPRYSAIPCPFQSKTRWWTWRWCRVEPFGFRFTAGPSL